MKHLYTMVFAMLAVSIAFAQAPVREYAGRAVISRAMTGTHVDYSREIIYQNTFGDCSNITFTNAYDEGYTDYIDGINFDCTDEGPSGPYNGWVGGTANSPSPDPNFTTADDGYVMVDSDLFGAEENYAASWVENCWFTIGDPVDFTDHPFVTVEFETRYRCWDNTTYIERCYLEISLDGVNWPDPETLEEDEGYVVIDDDTLTARYEVFPTFERGDETDDPTTIRFDIGDVAGDEAAVYFRWRWVGQWGYAWMVDDFVAAQAAGVDDAIEKEQSKKKKKKKTNRRMQRRKTKLNQQIDPVPRASVMSEATLVDPMIAAEVAWQRSSSRRRSVAGLGVIMEAHSFRKSKGRSRRGSL